MVVEIRDWCQNVGEYNTYNFCIWHFGLCVILSKIDRCRSSDPPYEIAINPIFRSYHVSDVIIQSFLNRSRWNLVHTLVARRARSAISDCLVLCSFEGHHLTNVYHAWGNWTAPCRWRVPSQCLQTINSNFCWTDQMWLTYILQGLSVLMQREQLLHCAMQMSR